MALDNLKGDLNATPIGLLPLLSLKTKGVNPDLLSSVLMPVLDTSFMYGLDAIQAFEASTSVNTPAGALGTAAAPSVQQLGVTGAGTFVPQDEAWRIRHLYAAIIDGSGTCTAMDVFQFAVMIRPPTFVTTNRAPWRVGPPMNRMTATYAAGSPAIFMTTPSIDNVLVPPGTSFGVSFQGYYINTANAVTLSIFGAVERYRI